MTDKMIYFFDLFFNMGRHTPYVWSSVGICILTYLSLYFYHIKTRRSLFHTLIKQQQRAERIALQSKGSPSDE